ncbi:YadA family autotransporter adhesin [Serratia fonticola]|uniref:YadA family autotransporter adhesin n=1 Tax=Serratia fonticola TaxID=47917 RepID=UPI00141A1373|nr:YadA family autotransporter adhesin [Serratia fonticola]
MANSFVSGKTLSVTQAPTNGVVAIGNRQIQGVADGQLSSTSTDAVNGSQLYQVTSGLNSNINELGTSAASALGGGAAYNASTGAWTAPSYSIQGTSYSNIGDAFGGVDSSLTTLTDGISKGTTGVVQRTSENNVATLTAAGGTADKPGEAQKLTNLAAGDLNANSKDAVNGSQLFATNSNVTANTTSIADNTASITNLTSGTAGLVKQDATTKAITVAADKAGTSVDLSGTDGSRTLKGVKAGTLSSTSTEAVNGSQLFATNTKVSGLGSGIASALGGGAAYNASTGAWTAPSYSIQGTSYSNIGDAFGGVDSSLTTLTDGISKGTTGVVQRTSENNVATLTAAGGTADKPGEAQKLTNLAAGDLNANSKDAVNGSQLFATNSNVTANTTSIADNTASITNLTSGTAGLVKQDATTKAITVAADKAGTSVDLSGTDGSRTLKGVKAGTLSSTSTEAVNGSQLFATNTKVSGLGSGIASALGGGAAYNASTGAWTAPSYSIQGTSYSNIGDAFGGVDSSLTTLTDGISKGTTGVVQRTSENNVATLTAAGGTADKPGEAQKLTNLAAGDLNANSKDAVNGSQLFATNSNVTANTTSIADNTASITNLTSGTAGLVKQDATTKAITVAADKAGTSVDLSGTDGSRTLKGVKAGTLSSTSTEAVNGSQLFATNTKVSGLGSGIASALGGGAAYNASTGAWTAPSYSIQGTSYSNIGDAFGGVDSSLTTLTDGISKGTTGVVQRTSENNVATLTAAGGTVDKPGEAQKLTNLAAGDLNANSKDAVNGSQLFATNSNVTANTTSIADNTASITNLTSGTAGLVKQDATTKAITVAADKAGTSVDLSGTDGSRTLKGVKAGTLSSTSTEAVNGSQLFATNTKVSGLGSGIASALGGGAAYNASTGAWTAPSYSIQGTSYSNIGDAFGGVDSSLTTLTDGISKGTTGVVQRTSENNVATLTAAGGTVDKPGEAQKLTNLAAGDLNANSKDAVNGSQLYAVADQVSKNTTDIAGLTTIVNNAAENNLVKQNSEDNSIAVGAGKAGKTVSLAGTEGNRTLSGVADGVAPNDAATVGQLQGVAGNLSSRDDTGLGVAKATGKNGLAVGAGTVASGDFSTASGAQAQATGANSSASGNGAKATAANASAFGQGATASGNSSLAAGQASSATGTQTVALGAGSSASGSRSVALGYGSVAERDNSVSVGSVGHERQVTNVAAGTARTDAANVGQVNDAFESLGNSVNKRINDLDDKLTGGIASAMALSGIPQAYLPDSSLVGASASTYNGQSAIAIGVSKTSENGKWIMKISGSGNTQNDFGGSVGVGYQW